MKTCLSQLSPTFRVGHVEKWVWAHKSKFREQTHFLSWFAPRFLRGDPIFSLISQQPTVETFSNLANRLITYRSIYWCCRLAFKKSPLSPWANTFLVPTGPGNPIFPPISQQPTVENFSTHENRLIRYQSIYCCCILAFKMWPQCRIHHLEETHPPYPRAEMPCFPQYLNNWT